MARRSRAREVTLQMLYQSDLNPDIDGKIAKSMIDERLNAPTLQEFAWELFRGVQASRTELDEQISSVAQNWSLSRMSPTDRNTIRLGAYELFSTDTPRQVVINEAVELARKYGSKNSSQFVNGILDKLNVAQKESTTDVEPARPADDDVTVNP